MHYKITTPAGLEGNRLAQIDLRAIAEAFEVGLCRALKLGYVVEVTLDPETPLAQGHYTPNIRIRERKDLGMARETLELTGGAS